MTTHTPLIYIALIQAPVLTDLFGAKEEFVDRRLLQVFLFVFYIFFFNFHLFSLYVYKCDAQ